MRTAAKGRPASSRADAVTQTHDGGNLITRWMAANLAVAQDPAGNLKPVMDRSAERIDGIVAIVMALGRAMLPQEPAPSYSVLILG